MTGSVTRLPSFKNVMHINAIGLTVAALIAIVLLPLLPFIAIIWLLGNKRTPGPDEEAV